MGRASKIFQSIYAAHAHAQEALAEWGVPTPPSESPPSSRAVLHGHEKPGRSIVATTDATGPKGKLPCGLLPSVEILRSPKAKKGKPQGKQSLLFHSTTTQILEISMPIEPRFEATELGSRGNNRVVSMRGRISAFPVAPSVKSFPSSLSNIEDSEEEEFDESDDEWEDNSYIKKNGVSLKEPAWEMLTPPSRVAA